MLQVELSLRGVGLPQDGGEITSQSFSFGIMSSRAIVATDCASVVALLQQHEDQRSRLKFIVDEAKAAGDELPEWTVIHTKRESNRVAHELAQLAKRTRHSAVWRFAAPTCVELGLYEHF